MCLLLAPRQGVQFSKTSRKAARLLLPYLAWAAFAGYLNLGVYLLNR